MTDNVNHPTHYLAGGFEALDVLEAFFPDDPLGWQVGKYMLRYKKKNGLEDLRKAEVYLKRLIAQLEAVDLDVLQPRGFVDYKPQPDSRRVWESFADVPEGVTVRDREGDCWRYEAGRRYLRTQGSARDSVNTCPAVDADGFPDEHAPFTEVLETE